MTQESTNQLLNQHSATKLEQRCVQCQTPVTTRFCGHCGRRVHQRSLLVDTALHTAQVLTNIDGRWRRTLRDLYLRPGLLLNRYLTTERHLYANPILMLLVISSLSVLLMNLMYGDLDFGTTNERLSSLVNALVNYSGYLAILSNVFTATLSKWLYPAASWSDRFVLLTYAAVFAGINGMPLGLLAAALQYDVNNWLIWCSQLTCCWVFWHYHSSMPRAIAMLVLSTLSFLLLSTLIGMCFGVYLAYADTLEPLRQLPILLGLQPQY